MYQRLVGEGGLDPHYFLHQMTLAEANDYIQGQDRRLRQQWEMTRMIVSTIAAGNGAKDFSWKFPWDEEVKQKEPSTEEQKKWEALKQRCMRINERNETDTLANTIR